jgi:hypothetical protein
MELIYSKCGSCNYEGPEFVLGETLAIDAGGKQIRERLCPVCTTGHATCTKGLWGI